jgi:pSer/pThr/pTyr-binding forkhead associated (FHA) protein
MPSPRFPATATLLDARQCPLEKFDALFVKITQERRIADGYFLQAHPDEARLLFVVNGSPYGAGRVVGEECTFLEIHEFFAEYDRHPESPLSFCVADKRLLLGLMVLFHHQPALTFRTDLVDMPEILEALAERKVDQILGLRSGDGWAVSICAKGKPVASFFPPGAGDAAKAASPVEQLMAYAGTHASGLTVDVYEETRVGPAGDATLATPETQGRLTEVFLRVAAKVQEEEAEAPLLLEMASDEPLTLETALPAAPPPAAAPVVVPGPEPPPIVLESSQEAAKPSVEAMTPPTLTIKTQGPPTPPAEAPPVAPRTAFKGPIPEVVLYLGDKVLGTFSLAGGELTIGRVSGNGIVIDNAGVSRRHAVIRVKEDKVFLEDLGSANGTFVRGQKIESSELHDGDEIMVVKHRLVYRIPKEADAPPKAEPAADAGQKTMYIDQAALAQAMGAKPGSARTETAAALRPRLILPDLKKFALEEDEVTLGSGASCQIKLSGMFVGKEHAKIVRTKEGQFKIQHLSGMAGTRVNGEKITEHVLKHGDEIEVGKQKLLFRLER